MNYLLRDGRRVGDSYRLHETKLHKSQLCSDRHIIEILLCPPN